MPEKIPKSEPIAAAVRPERVRSSVIEERRREKAHERARHPPGQRTRRVQLAPGEGSWLTLAVPLTEGNSHSVRTHDPREAQGQPRVGRREEPRTGVVSVNVRSRRSEGRCYSSRGGRG